MGFRFADKEVHRRMAKQGLTEPQIQSLLKDRASGPGWALCVGAGISRPAFPDWRQLVQGLMKRAVGGATSVELSNLETVYSPDAFIQAAMDRMALGEVSFANVLSEELYGTAKATLSSAEWKLFARALNTRHLGHLEPRLWRDFFDLVRSRFPGLTAMGLAETMVGVLGGPLAPRAILSFNAEPLFPALLNAHLSISGGSNSPSDAIDYVTRSTSNRKARRVPYIFCHGLLPVPGAVGPTLSSVDKLVFSEGSYLQLANNSFSWQSTSFIRAAANHSLVFVGLSLSDSNLRRWMSWVHSNRVAELTESGVSQPTSTVHYWIAKQPESDETKRWYESLVAHLGVRVIWVADYPDIPRTLQVMLGVLPRKRRARRIRGRGRR
jgi:SIR2-like domain